MEDQSYLDKRYFVDNGHYNCPFCNRNHVPFSIYTSFEFDWTKTKKCFGHTVKCSSCAKTSLHLSYFDIPSGARFSVELPQEINGIKFSTLDEFFFYHQPTSFFTMDIRIKGTIREHLTEAYGCLKMNHLTGASACLRKAIYELLNKEGIYADVGSYEDRIKKLKDKFPAVDSVYFDVLCNIKDMASDKVHEESWEKFDSLTLKELLEATKSILYEMYVSPDEKKNRLGRIPQLLESLRKDKKTTKI